MTPSEALDYLSSGCDGETRGGGWSGAKRRETPGERFSTRASTNPGRVLLPRSVSLSCRCRMRSHRGCNLITVLSNRNKDGQDMLVNCLV